MSNDHLYAKRRESINDNRDEVDVVQIITWNDYGESHYIGPIEGDQPNSQDWVDGFDHTAWLDMTTYYANAFKTGSFPEINQDKIYMWARPHPRDATASSDSIGKPQSYELMEDAVYAVVMASSPSKVTLSTGDSLSKTYDVPTGVTKLSIPFSAGGTIYGKVERDGNTIVELNPEFTFDANPKTYNYNAFVAFASGDENQPVSPPVETPGDNSPSSSVVSSSRIPDVPVTTPSPSPSSSPSPSPSPSSSPSPSLSSSSSPSPSPSSPSQSPSTSPSPSPSPSEGPASNPVPSPSSVQLNSGDNGDGCSYFPRYHRRSFH